ncbi:MAG: D-glycero-beta-D-manno-heptose 1,7-bisphosphate 7-phosphatase [Deltaproteobacteria bacterium]|jgi:D-glycero-D-manno-heptose 1,7-bisphosphate phosphatase|nr:D-glycero-beta-D-manno-heptose 1,7-bisphosphate 7-phosphatase [Deltaproteobacteria bacterium]
MAEGTRKKRPAVFIDRDGTLNRDNSYVWKFADFIWLDGVPEALARLKRAGLILAVITNQSGINRGYYTAADVLALHRAVDRDLLERVGVTIDGWYHCPHIPQVESCQCRKPKPGMILAAARDLSLDTARSYMVGDKTLDVLAGLAAGVKRSMLVRTGYGQSESRLVPQDTLVFDDFPRAADFILQDLASGNP